MERKSLVLEREEEEEGEEEERGSLMHTVPLSQLTSWAPRPCDCPGARARPHTEVVLAFELGPDCAGQCTAGAWHFSHHDISFPAQSFASVVPSARNILPHTPPSQCLR